MNNKDFWEIINHIIQDGFSSEGLQTLDYYADLIISGQCAFKRFSPQEQYGCSAGGSSHVIATILAGAENKPNPNDEGLSDFKREVKQAAQQARRIENWSRRVGIWIDDVNLYLSKCFGREIAEGGEARIYDNGVTVVKAIGLDYYVQPLFALDRISLHNAYFPETRLEVVGFGRDSDGEFKIIVEQAFIEGCALTNEEIIRFVESLGFELRDLRSWTYATPEIYLSDMHDENLIKSKQGNIFVIDCDIRINTPDLRQGGVRSYTSEVVFKREK